jgi:hypothetical protein
MIRIDAIHLKLNLLLFGEDVQVADKLKKELK